MSDFHLHTHSHLHIHLDKAATERRLLDRALKRMERLAIVAAAVFAGLTYFGGLSEPPRPELIVVIEPTRGHKNAVTAPARRHCGRREIYVVTPCSER